MIKIYSGIDLVALNRMDRLSPEIHTRFLQRVFTPQELEDAAGKQNSLMGKIAAKEAVSKALGCGIWVIGWQTVEILSQESGAPSLVLHSKAKEISEELGIWTWSISITHEKTHAAAVAIGLGDISRNQGMGGS